jgi:hypothetical protein
MGLRMDVLAGMSTLPFFSQGESHILRALERCSPFEHGGMEQQWGLFDSEWNTVMGYLRSSFAELGELDQWIYCNLQMKKLREMIKANKGEYDYSRSIAARASS